MRVRQSCFACVQARFCVCWCPLSSNHTGVRLRDMTLQDARLFHQSVNALITHGQLSCDILGASVTRGSRCETSRNKLQLPITCTPTAVLVFSDQCHMRACFMCAHLQLQSRRPIHVPFVTTTSLVSPAVVSFQNSKLVREVGAPTRIHFSFRTPRKKEHHSSWERAV